MVTAPFISGAVEGDIDDAVARRLVAHVGAAIGDIHVKYGKAALLARINGYNQAARHMPWLVLVDLDNDAGCAPDYVEECLPAKSRSNGMCLRVAVREIESWLLADPEHMATFLGVRQRDLPRNPDSLADPKATIVRLAARSRRRAIREDLVPRRGSGRPVGPAYNSQLMEFARTKWRPERAAAVSVSLAKCLSSLRRLAGQ